MCIRSSVFSIRTNPRVWVCPKRQLGLTYTTAGGTFDPTITGFLSYGFNEIGCFCLAGNPPGTSWSMQTPTPPFKATLAQRPAQLLGPFIWLKFESREDAGPHHLWKLELAQPEQRLPRGHLSA